MAIFPTKWRANEQQGEGWAPTSYNLRKLHWLSQFSGKAPNLWQQTADIWANFVADRVVTLASGFRPLKLK